MLAIEGSWSEHLQRPHWIIPITERHYIVIRHVYIRRETSPGLYGSHEAWRTSFFYITSRGANYWLSLPRFFTGVNRFKEVCRIGKKPPRPFISEPRPELAVWVESEHRRGGLFFKPYLEYTGTPGTHTVGTNTDTPYSYTAEFV